MPKHKGGKVAAVIDIGSSDVKMQISQVRNKEIIPLNTLEYPLKLGHEVFNYGKISFECLRELSHKMCIRDSVNTGSTLHGWTDKALKPFNMKKRYPELYETILNAME